MSTLTHIVAWSQRLAREVLRPGDLAIDLTAGRGRDTFALAEAVGVQGQVVSFDLQAYALEQTMGFLRGKGLSVHSAPVGQVLGKAAGIFLVQACHSTLGTLLRHPAKVIIANLGYLPGGDQSLITRPATTLEALRQSLGLLVPGGRLVVTVYPAHAGGAEEEAMVIRFFKTLPAEQWQALTLSVTNCSVAPCLLVAERIA